MSAKTKEWKPEGQEDICLPRKTKKPGEEEGVAHSMNSC